MTFNELVERVRKEAGLSTNTSRGIDHRENIEQLIQRHHEALALEYDWPILKIAKEDARKNLQAGERYYDLPVDLDRDRPYHLSYRQSDGDQYQRLEFGIGPEEYSAFDSDNPDVRNSPAVRWDFYGDRQFEIWPCPDINSASVWFTGFRRAITLVNATDRCDMDSLLVILRVASELIKDEKRAEKKAAAAADRYNQLTGKANNKQRIYGLGMGDEPPQKPRSMVLVTSARRSV